MNQHHHPHNHDAPWNDAMVHHEHHNGGDAVKIYKTRDPMHLERWSDASAAGNKELDFL